MKSMLFTAFLLVFLANCAVKPPRYIIPSTNSISVDSIDYWCYKNTYIKIVKTVFKKNEYVPVDSLIISQTDSSFLYKGKQVYFKADSPAVFPFTDVEFNEFLIKNQKIPQYRPNIQGSTFVCIIISDSGKISNIGIIRGGLDYEYDENAINIVKKLPDFIPAINKGKAVNCLYTIRIPIIYN